MHEFSMTTQIVENVLREAKKHAARKVVEVHLIIGKLTFLGIEQIKFSYDVLIKGTMMDGSTLHIEEKDAVGRCVKCGFKNSFPYKVDPIYHLQYPTFSCPKCGGHLEIVTGKECTIKSIRLIT